jgi:hypothetical protein
VYSAHLKHAYVDHMSSTALSLLDMSSISGAGLLCHLRVLLSCPVIWNMA